MHRRHDPVLDLLSQIHHADVLQVLSGAVPYLNSAEQAVVRFILDRPDELEQMSAGQLAEATGVSEATVYRVCRQLGLPGFSGLKKDVADAVAHYADSFLSPVDFSRPDGADGLMMATVYAGIRLLVDSLAITDDDITRTADAIVSARRVVLCGVGAYTARLCQMAAFGLQRTGLTCMLWLDGEISQVQRDMLHEDDVVMGLSYSGANKSVAHVLALGKEAGAKTVSLTNYRFSPVAQPADIRLVTAIREEGVQNFELLPRVAHLLVLQAIVAAVKERLAGGEVKRSG